MYPTDTNGTGDFPHHSSTCKVVNGAQMIIHGGYFPSIDSCDSEGQWGLHNLDLGRQNKEHSEWQLYEPASKTRYVVPEDVLSVVGGEPTGGATKTAPDEGFLSSDLGILLTRTASVTERTATRPVSGPTDSTATDPRDRDGGPGAAAIAGIAIGGALAVALAMACFLLIRRHHRRNCANTTLHQSVPVSQRHPGTPHSDPPPSISWHPQSSSSHHMASPSQSLGRPPSIQPYRGPPVELASAETCEVEGNYPCAASLSPDSEAAATITTLMAPKYDAYGNLWLPQVSVMQGPVVSAQPPTGNSFESLSPANKPRSEHLYGPVWPSRDVEFEMTTREQQQQQQQQPQNERPSQQQASRGPD
jgi:hypothetical protein